MDNENASKRSTVKSKIVDRIAKEVESTKAQTGSNFITGEQAGEASPGGPAPETYYKTYYKGGSYVKG
ncbi:hypothetical protein [Mesorhizobium sp.]|uniref:hypothetical protein n=1 Tax=Mesorhizobium sp. TaxID=1871066 RepID=UPI001226A356|nr:hypothetical protein [Mesorhizobium sp.]TIS62491.1 MAG: hypothetical protein E5W92_30825 [Mesorhizobium sp.]